MPVLDLSEKPVFVMGILNATPDSFSDGGVYSTLDSALIHAKRMWADGADIVDIGGESTRPGAKPVSVAEELDRVIPIIEALVKDDEVDLPISIDTSKPEVMREAVSAGAVLVNDVRALTQPGALEVCAELGVSVCLMHMLGQPRTMQQNPQYDDVLSSVAEFLLDRAKICENAGIAAEKIILDPGIGFGKTLQHNLRLLGKLDALAALGYPTLIGVSRKSMFQKLLDLPLEERVIASVVTAVLSAQRGAKILRVHDVKETVQGLSLLQAIESAGEAS